MSYQVSKTKRFFKRIEGFFSSFKQRYILHYLMTRSGGQEIVSSYKDRTCDPNENIGATSPIWVCWWQGEEQMPDIVKACYHSIQKHACTHPVILITSENYQKYVDIPEEILNKQKSGIIDITHFSDILRMMLLRKHGGIWMDSTLLIPSKNWMTLSTRKIYSGVAIINLSITTYHVEDGSAFCCLRKGNLLPSIIADLHLSYWRKHNKLIDYLLLDYTFAIARAHVPAIRHMIEQIPITVMGPLGKCLNDEYTEEAWQKFCTDYDFHKLTYKIPLQRKTPEGKKTFYGHIMEEFFDKE